MDKCLSGSGCGLCFARRLRYQRKGPGNRVLGRPLTAGQWRLLLGPVAKYEGYPYEGD